jgi:hypothetical protein
MSLSVAIAIIVLADLAIIAAVSYVMSRANLLTPHISAMAAPAFQPVQITYAATPAATSRNLERRGARLERIAA